MSGYLINKVQYVLASRGATGKYTIISKQGVSDTDAELIISTAQTVGLKSITPFIGVKDSSKGLLLSGADSGDLIKIVSRSFYRADIKNISLYLLHRLSQGLLFLRSQTDDAIMEGFIQSCKLSPETGRFDKKTFIDYFSSKNGIVGTALWANLSSFLAKMDQEYLDAQPLVDVLLRSLVRMGPNYEPRFDSTMNFDLPLNKVPSDILLIGGIVSEDRSIIAVLLDKQDSYSRSIVQEGFITDSKAKSSLVNFINDDPFLKAAFSTSQSSLDGDGLVPEKLTDSEEIVKDAMISIEKNKSNDVYELNASWFDWWIQRNSK